MSAINILRKSVLLLGPRGRHNFYVLCGMAVVGGFLEVLAVSSVAPFLATLARPALAERNPELAKLQTLLGAGTPTQLLTYLGGIVLLILVVSNAFSAATTWLTFRFANRQGHALSIRMLATYLAKPYVFHLDRHVAELQKNVFSEIQRVSIGILTPAVQIIGKLSVTLLLCALLVLINPLVAFVMAAALAVAYGILYRMARVALHTAGQVSVEANTLRNILGLESLTGVKEIKLLGREEAFLQRVAGPSLRWADAYTTSLAVAQLPRYIVETVAFTLILLLAIYLLGRGSSTGDLLPLLGLYAFAGYRLMPALQQIFAGFALMRSSQASLEAVLADLEPRADPLIQGDKVTDKNRIPINAFVEMIDVRYQFPGETAWALQPISLRIPKNSSVALVGSTGSGKTTVVNLLMGLLPPLAGSLVVDGVRIDEYNVRQWQRSIGHVPQQIFLCDDTIARNIALGLSDEEIDMAQVERVCRLARLHEFIARELPKGYLTVVGDRGIRLSGGQRQRIGIARAMYSEPDLLVLDEATSALDNVTENAVFEALQAIAGSKTIVMVAHRLSTVRSCDVICVMEQGRIVERGTYEELIGSSERFRALSTAGNAG